MVSDPPRRVGVRPADPGARCRARGVILFSLRALVLVRMKGKHHFTVVEIV